MAFLKQCTASRAAYNIRQIVNLGIYSRTHLQALRQDIGIEYDHLERGILHFYTNPGEFESALNPARIMRELGCDRQVIDANRAVELEPALAPVKDRIAGATYTSEDESGDARQFTQALAKKAEGAGVEFLYNSEILGFENTQDRVLGVNIIREGRHQILRADNYVLCLGSYSATLARKLGLTLNVYPAKGYSITVPVKNEAAAFNVSLTDDEYKLVYSRLGDRIRVAGTAELSGYNRELNLPRCRAIVRRTAELMPDAGHWEKAEFWAGLRPATPSNVPYIGKSHFGNLYLNTGHGTLGWTHSCGSAAALADIVAGRTPRCGFCVYRALVLLQLIPDQFLVDLADARFRYVVDEINLVRYGPLIDLTGIHELLQVILDIVQ
jgi:D-amino-acid dehydrogenase